MPARGKPEPMAAEGRNDRHSRTRALDCAVMQFSPLPVSLVSHRPAPLSRDNSNVEVDEVRLVLEVQDLEPGLTRSHAVASYVRAMLKLNALRRELGDTLLVVEGRKKALRGLQLAEAQRLLDRYGLEAR
jgi:hypothetical protein